jgi:hypothetical protein
MNLTRTVFRIRAALNPVGCGHTIASGKPQTEEEYSLGGGNLHTNVRSAETFQIFIRFVACTMGHFIVVEVVFKRKVQGFIHSLCNFGLV